MAGLHGVYVVCLFAMPLPAYGPAAAPRVSGAPGPRAFLHFDLAVDAFLEKTRHTRSASPHTRRAYATDLAHYGGYLDATALAFDALSRLDAERYVARLASEAGPRTVRRRVSCLRSFYRWLVGLGELETNPFTALSLPAFDPQSETHKVWSEEETEKALALLRCEVREAKQAYARSRRARDLRALVLAARRRALVVLMLAAGLRREEAAHLTKTSLVQEADGFYLRVVGKGRKMREVPHPRLCLPGAGRLAHAAPPRARRARSRSSSRSKASPSRPALVLPDCR